MQTRFFTVILLAICWVGCGKTGEYVCTPCELSCDELTFAGPGTCPHCGMALIHTSEVPEKPDLVLNDIQLSTGSGVFLIEGGAGHENKTIKVYYHQPTNFTQDSRILIVIPGAGRNGDSYRDAWIEASEQYGVLILSPMYGEADYPFEAYHLGGLISDANLKESVEFVKNTNVAKLNEELFSYEVNKNREEWLFPDFDRLFERVVNATGSTQAQYDMFGHSAGGQILHRLAIFHPDSRANRIIAGNSGFYTLPDVNTELPFGIQNAPLNQEELARSFQNKLVLLIGELDNADEQGGTLLRSQTVDKQGVHRLERGKYFYETSRKIASEMGATYHWELQLVPGVGHDHRKMGKAAAQLLYGGEE